MNTFIEVPANKISISHRKPIFGVGINDADYLIGKIIDGKQTRCPYYARWLSMLQRCYDAKYQEKQPTYIGCRIVKEWLIFSNFKRWMKNQDWEGKELDKDILKINNKKYSPKFCCFVPCAINTLLGDCGTRRGSYPQGVSWYKTRLNAKISINGKIKYLGSFKTIAEAEHAYKIAKKAYIIELAETQPLNIKEGLLRHAALLS